MELLSNVGFDNYLKIKETRRSVITFYQRACLKLSVDLSGWQDRIWRNDRFPN